MRDRIEADRLNYLLEAYINNVCSREEMEELFRLVDREQDEQLLPILQTQWEKARAKKPSVDVDWNHLYGAMISQSQYLERPPSSKSRGRRRRRVGIIASILFLLLVSVGAVLYFFRVSSTPSPSSIVAPIVSRFKNDVQPGGNKARLTLSDGSSIVLDSADNGMLSLQGSTKVIKLANGRLAYQTGRTAEAGNLPLFNTISTPRGGQYQVVLPDGSKVWLDASSFIRFPTVFDTKERKVELSGEAYFEVTATAHKPFIVSVLSRQKEAAGELQKIAVLGTRFNVMAYEDENRVETTLLEGAVEVAGAAGQSQGAQQRGLIRQGSVSGEIKLKPGEQAQLTRNDLSRINVVNNVDVDAAVAWKNGYFDFNRADIHTIMRQLSRWYDVEVIYQGTGKGKEFWGGMQRNLPLTAVFRILEKSGVEFSIDGKKVLVNM